MKRHGPGSRPPREVLTVLILAALVPLAGLSTLLIRLPASLVGVLYPPAVVFTKRLREGVRRGRIRCSIRIWTKRHRFRVLSMKSINSRDTLVSAVPTESSCDEWLWPRLCRYRGRAPCLSINSL